MDNRQQDTINHGTVDKFFDTARDRNGNDGQSGKYDLVDEFLHTLNNKQKEKLFFQKQVTGK
jgi:hypothetical protein